MTPGELAKVQKAVADAAAELLSREGNESLSAEELGQELATKITETVISTYEEIQAAKYNLVVLGHFRLEDDTSYVAAVGPLSTRAPQRARAVGERFAWDYKTRKGTGKFVLVPLVRDPNEAWDAARLAEVEEYVHTLGSITSGTTPSYEPMRLDLSEAIRSRIKGDWQMDPEILLRKFGPHCLCGRYTFPEKTHLGDPVTLGCPLHTEEGSSNGPT